MLQPLTQTQARVLDYMAAPIALPPGERSDLTNRPRLQAALQLADNPDGISVPPGCDPRTGKAWEVRA